MNIIITGASKGIGRELALSLADDPVNRVIVTSRSVSALKNLAEGAIHKNIYPLVQDLTTIGSDINHFRNSIISYFTSIDIFINNAGLLIPKKITDITEKEMREMMDVNFFAPVILVKQLLHLMNRGSHILNISSMGGVQGSTKYGGLAVYSSSKAALATLTECLALELIEYDIRVNCLALGSVQTEMVESAFPGYKAPISSKEMAEFISYFALNGSKYFNGKIIPVAINNP